MNTDAFEGSETVETASPIRGLPYCVDHKDSHTDCAVALSKFGDGKGRLGYDAPDAVDQDMRLKRCGIVFYDDQLSSERWVAPPGGAPDSDHRIKVLPLYLQKPVPGMRIEATDGEKYLLPKDFKGDWVDVAGPSGRKLIP